MKNISFILFFISSVFVNAQAVENLNDQNPNHKNSYNKYLKESKKINTLQNTTSQETYIAIDPIEEKRIRKKTRKDLRSKRALWRHQERMERAKNRTYYYDNYYYSGFRSSYNYISPLLTLGLASYLLFD